ncbi:MAG: hypothetical protein ACYCPT_11090 [Acidimicrobiales bacterium]
MVPSLTCVAFVVAGLLLGLAPTVSVSASGTTSANANASTSWTLYHSDDLGGGVSRAIASVNTSKPA